MFPYQQVLLVRKASVERQENIEPSVKGIQECPVWQIMQSEITDVRYVEARQGLCEPPMHVTVECDAYDSGLRDR